MKKLINVLFVVLGVIFLLIILCGIYVFVFDPLNLKPMLFGTSSTNVDVQKESVYTSTSTQKNTGSGTSTSATTKIVLSAEQKSMLEKFGVNPATLPSTLTTAQETCLTGKLGTARIAEIMAGAVPSAIEIFSAKSCI